MNGLKKSSHSVHSLNYHLIQCVKGKKKVFKKKEIVELLKTQIYKISKTFDVEVLQIETNNHYFHMLFNSKPTLNIPKYLNAIKCITSREIQKKFPVSGRSFWHPSYFLATSGQVTLETLKKYIDKNEK